jgi:hypothetical protein
MISWTYSSTRSSRLLEVGEAAVAVVDTVKATQNSRNRKKCKVVFMPPW